ncbi:MAG: hypothetical protein COW03_18245 [Cytophagales bacterium CG12_big_fil_rev_8_21_14_0_65_40_12]|nr:MAG: hypothetical protein COW03_18245 [Cytophagales bacterium CG12_big_fil_rev_8_21_14_0_65_40_12]PIW05244.1 MAG: hypothetical protein COW40_05455 [Cytophagales bacterium CG17_big_fil_post_rev_8_21_14_2_50_40_13]
MKALVSIVLFLLSYQLSGQFAFRFENGIPMSINNSELSRAWEGGVNSAQFQKMDLNGDEIEDLIIFHRISGELTTYLAENEKFIWAPEYKGFFPPEITNWFILADYNCDGKKDIFTSVPQGVTVYENISTGATPEWQQAIDFLRFDGGVNIQVNASDIPGIADIDGDGDLDILSYRFTTASTIDFYKNTSVENGDCSALTFERVARRWGEFEECGCDDFAFGGSCPIGGAANLEFGINDEEDLQHAGGKTITLFDADNDGDLDLITSDEFCQTLYFMTNVGDSETALMTSFVSYPEANPAAFQVFPTAFLEDINFDGQKELIISSNADGNVLNTVDFRNTSKIYSSSSTPAFNFETASIPFLQNEMLDLGENTYPSFADFDNDGDLDFFIGTRGELDEGVFAASIYQFENTGGQFNPSFQLIDNDFLEFKSSAPRNIKPQFIDLDGNGIQDLIYQSTGSNNITSLQYRLNTGNFTFGEPQTIAFSLSENDNVHFYDVNSDGEIDLLRAASSGAVSLYLNQGNFNFDSPINGFAGITSNFLKRNPTLIINDFNSDGKPELITLDNSGNLNVLSGTINEDFTPASTQNQLLQNSLVEELNLTNLSDGSWLTSADLFGNGKPAIIIGNNRGGIYILANESATARNGEDNSITLTTFPNPTSGSFFLRTDVDAVFELYTVQGQKILENINLSEGVTKEIPSSNLAAGIYLIRVFNGTNTATVKRIIIQK